MPDLAIRYDAPPTLGRFMGSDAFVRMAMGPFGSGKSSCACVEVMRRAAEMPKSRDGKRHSRCAIVRNTYPELRDTTRKTFEQWVPDGPLGRWRESDFAFDMKFNDVECEVMFRSLDRPGDVKKLLSLELSFAYVNECRELSKGLFDGLCGRVGRYPRNDDIPPENWWMPDLFPYWTGVWADTNPCDDLHWIYKTFEEERPEIEIEIPHRVTGQKVKVTQKFEIFHQPSGRSPQGENIDHLRPGYYQTLMLGKSPDWIKIYVDGEYGFDRTGKAIYPEYQDGIHCSDKFDADPRLDLLLGMDFGLTPAAPIGQRDPRDGQIQIFDELTSESLGASSFAQELARIIKTKYPGRVIRGHGDPAGEQRSQVDERTPFDVVRAAGLPLNPAPTNDFTLRREAVACNLMRLTIMGRPGIVIHPRCKFLRKAMGGSYQYPRLNVGGGERFGDKPLKNIYSHVAEALQYLCVGEGEDRRAVGLPTTPRKHRSIRANGATR